MLSLEALDTLFFRDGLPFNKEGDNWVNCLFPPAPSVIYGALRSLYFAENISEFSKANQDNDPTRNLKIKGIFLQAEDTVYFPLPFDLVKNKGDKIVSINPEKADFVSNCLTEMVLMAPEDEEVKNVESGLLDDISLKDYLSGNNQYLPYRGLSEFVTNEPKVSIGIDIIKGLAQDGMLYRVGMIRPELLYTSGQKIGRRKSRKIRILVDYEGLPLPFRGLIKVGGEGKVMSYKHCREEGLGLNINWPEVRGNMFKVYLATPAKFSKGWLPDWIDERSYTGIYEGISLKLMTAAIGRYVSIGGFDMKNKQPKPMLRAVPAGSVYYFQVLDGSDLEEVMAAFHYSNISDFDKEQGFGLTFAGVVAL